MIRRVPVLLGEVQVNYVSSRFWRPTFHPQIRNACCIYLSATDTEAICCPQRTQVVAVASHHYPLIPFLQHNNTIKADQVYVHFQDIHHTTHTNLGLVKMTILKTTYTRAIFFPQIAKKNFSSLSASKTGDIQDVKCDKIKFHC